jgi:outer membrane receptor protein involved in Fe transport
MVGQAEYVVNAGLSYFGERVSANVLYNVVGSRIREAALLPFPDVIEHERHVVDVSVQTQLMPRTTFKIDARNLLDAPYRLTQGPVERGYYRTGRSYSFGVSWTP